MRLSPLDIKKQEFSRTIRRGYDPDEVQAFLDMLAGQWEDLLAEQRRTEDKVRELKAKMGHYEKVEEALQEALRTARESSRQTLENAKQEAALIIKKAHAEADDLARAAVKRRDGLLQEADELIARRDGIIARLRAFLAAESELLERFEGRSAGAAALLSGDAVLSRLPEPVAEAEEAEPADVSAPLDLEASVDVAAGDVQRELEEQDAVAEPEAVVQEEAEAEPVADEPVIEAPIMEEAAADEVILDEPVAEEMVVDEVIVDEPVAEEMVVDEVIAEEPIADEAERDAEPAVAEIDVEVIDVASAPEIDVEVIGETPIDQTEQPDEEAAPSIEPDDDLADAFFEEEESDPFSGDEEPLSFKFFESNEEDAATFLADAEDAAPIAPPREEPVRKKGARSRTKDRSPSDNTWIVRPVVSSGQAAASEGAVLGQSDEVDKIRRILSDLD